MTHALASCPIMPEREPIRDRVLFQRRGDFPGVELWQVEHSERPPSGYGTGFEFVLPHDFHTEVWHRGRFSRLEPGSLLCSHPGEIFTGRRANAPGAWSSLTIEPETFERHAPEPLDASTLRLRPVSPISGALEAAFHGVLRVFRSESGTTELRGALSEFVARVLVTLREETPPPPARLETHSRAADVVRERLHNDHSGTTDLETLARATGLSRFQALRAFKRCYGLPPLTYQLRVRLGLAQKSLRAGTRPARVAEELGFVDQSHLTRHFKRLVGVTPAEYARCGFAR